MKKLRILLYILLLILMLSSCDDNNNKTAGHGARANIVEMETNIVYVFTTYMTGEISAYSFDMYTYPNANVIQYDWYFIVEYEEDGLIYKEFFSNSAFGYYYKEEKNE